MKEIEIKCKGNVEVEIDEVVLLQGKMKKIKIEVLEKLKRAIIENGFSAPILIWNSDRKYIIDGHQRIIALKSLLKDGYKIGKIPAVEVEAKDKKEAVLKVMEMGVNYGYLYKKGLIELAERYEIDLELIEGLVNVELVKVEVEKPEYEISPMLLEENNYVVLKFDNMMDWQVAKDVLGIKSVKTVDSREGYERVGIGRVIYGNKIIEILKKVRDEYGVELPNFYTE